MTAFRKRKLLVSALEDAHCAKEVMSVNYFSSVERKPQAPFSRSLRLKSMCQDASSQVHAIGVGRKFVDGKPTNTVCVRLYVTQKLPKSLLGQQLLPGHIDGIPTDIIEAAPAFFAAPIAICSLARLRRRRPLVPGHSLGSEFVAGGTLGARCTSRRPGEAGIELLLSNNHVLADFGEAPQGSAIRQPSVRDGGGEFDGVASLLRFIPVVEGTNSANEVDAAVASLNPGIAIGKAICAIGTLAGVGTASNDLLVHKHGRTTGYSVGIVDDISCDVIVPIERDDPTRVARFVNQIRIRPRLGTSRFAQQGDSGSVVATTVGNLAVGLLFACPDDGTYAYANPMRRVLDLLDVEMN